MGRPAPGIVIAGGVGVGPYRTARAPYMKAVTDALSPRHSAQRVVFMKAAQVGATEAGNNWIGFCMHRAPGPFLAVSQRWIWRSVCRSNGSTR